LRKNFAITSQHLKNLTAGPKQPPTETALARPIVHSTKGTSARAIGILAMNATFSAGVMPSSGTSLEQQRGLVKRR
jgi:hypothetical protein